MIISIQNQKGGVGKTTTAVSLAAVAQAAGWRCLLVDLDPQASASDHFALDVRTGAGDLLLGASSFESTIVKTPIGKNGHRHLDVIGANDGLLEVERKLQSDPDPLLLSRILSRISNSYDCVLVDVGPSISYLAINALYAADTIICPLTLHATSLKGLQRLFELTSRAANNGHHPNVLILPVAADQRLKETREILRVLCEAFGAYPAGSVLRPVRYSSALSRAFGEQISIVDYDRVHQYKNGNRIPAAARAVGDYAATLEAIMGRPKRNAYA